MATIENDCILVGDFNLVMSPQKDYFNYLHVNNHKSRDKVLEIVWEYNLIDCWREEHIEERKFTWFKNNPIKQARLDFFLISSMLYSKVKNPDITSGYRTDQSHISLDITLDKTDKGNSYWKFNDSLLRDIQYVNKIKGLINRIQLQYSTNAQQGENSLLNDRDIQFNINDQLFFETLMMEIRGETISITSYKKIQQTNKHDKLLKEID